MSSRTLDDLAILGGDPLFDALRPTAQLYAPERAAFIERLEGILDRRWFSNGGEMQAELEARLTVLHDVQHVIAFANASLGLVALMRGFSRPDATDIVLPAFSYRGLPHLIQWAGKRPRFGDVDASTQTLSSASVDAVAGTGEDIAAVLAVNHVNAPADIDGLAALGVRLGVPVIYDSVYAICASLGGQPFGGNGLAEVFSLHATKLINGFEGGYVTTNDAAVADELRAIRNFGYQPDNPRIDTLGFNGKLNEIHAAMAIGSIEHAEDLVARNTASFDRYRSAIDPIAGLTIIEPAPGLVSNHEMVLLHVDDDIEPNRDDLLTVLQAEGALARPYFSPPLHLGPHCPPDVSTPPLPVSEALSHRYIQLPTGQFLVDGDEERLAEVLRLAVEAGEPFAARIRTNGDAR